MDETEREQNVNEIRPERWVCVSERTGVWVYCLRGGCIRSCDGKQQSTRGVSVSSESFSVRCVGEPFGHGQTLEPLRTSVGVRFHAWYASEREREIRRRV